MKKILVFCFVALALVLTGCKKDKDNDKKNVGFNGFTINQGTSLQMAVNSTVRLSMAVQGDATPDFTYQSANDSLVYVDETGVLYAIAETESPVEITVTGTAVVNNEKVTHQAKINVTVVDFASSLVFNEFIYQRITETYAIYRIRSLSTNGDDVERAKNRVEGDRNDVRAILPKYNEWVHLYDTVMKDPSTGESKTYQRGLFMDSVQVLDAICMSTDLYFDNDGNFQCPEQGSIFWVTDAFMFDNTYWYCLGDREIVDDVTANDTILADGKDPMPYPGYIQAGHFNEDNYIEYYTQAFAGAEEPDTTLKFWDKYDSYMTPVVNQVDPQGEIKTYILDLLGYPVSSKNPEVFSGFVIDEDENRDMFLSAYDFWAVTYGEVYDFCFKYDEQTQDLVDPLELVEPKDVHYVKATAQAAAARVNGNHIEKSNFRPVPKAAVTVKMKVNNTMGATFFMTHKSK